MTKATHKNLLYLRFQHDGEVWQQGTGMAVGAGNRINGKSQKHFTLKAAPRNTSSSKFEPPKPPQRTWLIEDQFFKDPWGMEIIQTATIG